MTSEAVPVLINGVRSLLPCTLDEAGHAWVPLRALYEALPLAWKATHTYRIGDDQAELIYPTGSYFVPVEDRSAEAWVAVLELLKWGILPGLQAERRELHLTSV